VNGTSAIGNIGPTAIAVGGDSVYIAGDFTKVKGADRNWTAAVDPVTAAIKPWNPNPDITPFTVVIASIQPAGNTVYLSGLFHSLGDFDYNTRIAEVTATTGEPTDWDAPVSNPGARDLAITATTIFAAGDFFSVSPRHNLAEFSRTNGDPTDWKPLLTGTSPPGQPETMYLGPDGTVYIGGNFTAIGGVWQQGFAAFSGGTPPPVAPANTAAPQISGTVAVGQTVTCSQGTWAGSDPITYTYTWLRDGTAVAGPQAGATYAVVAADAGHQLVCRVGASNSAGSLSADSAAVSVPTPGENPPPPAPDADGDGIPDSTDACPAVSDLAAQRSPRTGCPAEVVPPGPTAGNDHLVGDALANTICGLGGNDFIDGGGGNDTLFGDACNVKNKLVAGAPVFAAAADGNDTLLGSDGNDTLYGAGGKDSLKGGKGNDKLFGGRGNDKLDGGKGVNTYKGGAGDDSVNARNGARETIDCGPGKKDRATVDKRDRVKKCEKVKRAKK
jgi:Ca2+-binding RTX toxin-like protein